MEDIVCGAKGKMMNNFIFGLELDLDSIKDLNLPVKFKEFIKVANAASPKKDILVINGKEYIVNNILDFNKCAKHENFFKYKTKISEFLNPNQIPFSRDGFGNVFLLDIGTMIVSFYNHETGEISDLIDFDSFIKILNGNA